MENEYRRIIEQLRSETLNHADFNHTDLQHTPRRAAQAMRYLTQGYQQTLPEITKNAVFTVNSDEMVIVKDIDLHSLCEHHLLPFIGQCHIGYLPTGKVLGLSKVAQVVNLFAHRLQIQERLSQQIADAILEATQAKGVGVIIEARHVCMMIRGQQQASMTTSVMLGSFKHNSADQLAFLNLINRG
jgi:GTP cyclohydrolase I